MPEALRILATIPLESLDTQERNERQCLLQTFMERKPPPLTTQDPFLVDLIGVYREYWIRSLLKEVTEEQGYELLSAALFAFLQRHGAATGSLPTLDDRVAAVRDLLQRRGLHVANGVTLPLYDLMIWARQQERRFPIHLPETEVEVPVVLLEDFAVLGWSALATCNTRYTGGWADREKLYCVAHRYDLSSESFRMYLLHEGQHFADYRRYPKLEQPELEYRAKLAELALATTSVHELVVEFAGRGGDDRNAPHNFANSRVLRALARALPNAPTGTEASAWNQIPAAAIKREAEALLKQNSETLDRLGAATVTRVLE